MMHRVMLPVCRSFLKNDYSFQFSNVGSYALYLPPKIYIWNLLIVPFEHDIVLVSAGTNHLSDVH